MNILRINTPPKFEIVPREKLDVSRALKVIIKNEDNQSTQEVLSSVESLENENYQLTLISFPVGKAGEKFSYSIVDNLTNDLVSLGKFLIVLENENIQDYSKKSINKFYS